MAATAKWMRQAACRDSSFPLNFSVVSWIIKYAYIFCTDFTRHKEFANLAGIILNCTFIDG
jgi:hypothetical protein